MHASAPVDPATGRLIAQYLASPTRYRGSIESLASDGLDPLPSATLLVVADARLRGSDFTGAAEAFAEVLSRAEGDPWTGFAELGLGWIAVAQGDVVAARGHFDAIAASGARQSRDLVLVTLGLLDAYDGGGAVAARSLQSLATAPETSTGLRMVARMGAAYAHYWVDDYTEAAAAFDSAALEYPASPLADDARYAAAWSRWQAGEGDAARRALQRVAREHRTSGRRAPATLEMVHLERDAVLTAGLRSYRGVTTTPADRLAKALDMDGVKLARAALRLVREGDPGERAAEVVPAVVAGAGPMAAEEAGVAGRPAADGPAGAIARARSDPAIEVDGSGQAPDASRHLAPADGGSRWMLWMALGLVGVLAAGALLRALRTSERPRTAARDLGA